MKRKQTLSEDGAKGIWRPGFAEPERAGEQSDSRYNIPTCTDHHTVPRALLPCSLSSMFSKKPDCSGSITMQLYSHTAIHGYAL
jgi:hypothetical protein